HTRSKRDWSSDVCSSDLHQSDLIDDGDLISRYTDIFVVSEPDEIYILIKRMHDAPADSAIARFYKALNQNDDFVEKTFDITMARSEERRVGRECKYRRAR